MGRAPLDTDGYPLIEDHGIIGDLSTVALVSMDASIDFMCFPRFDAPTVFGSLLDKNDGGYFQIRPCFDGASSRQMYLPDTNVLLTRFLSRDGVAEVSDFMPIHLEGDDRAQVVRRVKCVRGAFNFDMVCAPRFEYGRVEHATALLPDGAIFVPQEPTAVPGLRLYSQIPLTISEGGAQASHFELVAGDSVLFLLEEMDDDNSEELELDLEDFATTAFKDTVNYWRAWISENKYRGRWREVVNRSALTLKLLVSDENGSLVAAPTFGLPEEVGGERNWDYRYTWIRDASLTLRSLMQLGYTEESARFMDWIEARAADLNPDGSLQIMYGIDGRKHLDESELSHWEGYRSSAPVRIGNGAYDQLQLDIYGELMDSVYIFNRDGDPISNGLWTNLIKLIEWVCENWQQPDEGIWEVRGGRKEFLYSRLLSWLALDRGVKIALERSFPAPLVRWVKVRDSIYNDIFTNFFNEDLQAFVQYKGAATLDGSTLLMPLVGFISPTDPKWLSTLAALERELVEDSHVYRYKTTTGAADGLDGVEGTFNMVSFWYAEVLALSGDVEGARYVFEKMLGYANHLGLFGEELGPHGEQLGNFPQAFTHLGLISAAQTINRLLDERQLIS